MRGGYNALEDLKHADESVAVAQMQTYYSFKVLGSPEAARDPSKRRATMVMNFLWQPPLVM